MGHLVLLDEGNNYEETYVHDDGSRCWLRIGRHILRECRRMKEGKTHLTQCLRGFSEIAY